MPLDLHGDPLYTNGKLYRRHMMGSVTMGSNQNNRHMVAAYHHH